ncbi:MAG: NnrS family protein, partial [Limisphaerales bacterium]
MAEGLSRITSRDIGKEPFRAFFPAGVLAGIFGVALWPLHFGGIVAFYPGQAHVRLMAYGFFGAFILGFLGTALPRMMSAPVFGVRNVALLLTVYTAMAVAFGAGKILWGDGL